MATFTRRNLPHWQPAGAVIFVTYHLFGSLPARVAERLEAERRRLEGEPPREGESPRDRGLREGKRMFALADRALADQLRGGPAQAVRYLEDPRVARMVRENLAFHDGTRFRLHRFVIMPNHVHVLIEPLPVEVAQAASLCLDSCATSEMHRQAASATTTAPAVGAYWPLSRIMHGLKSYTANQANRLLERQGAFWQEESFDHWVRDAEEYGRIVAYIDANPVEAGLCERADAWVWSTPWEEGQGAS